MSEEHTTGAKPGGVGSDLSGELQGQENCNTDIGAGTQTSAS